MHLIRIAITLPLVHHQIHQALYYFSCIWFFSLIFFSFFFAVFVKWELGFWLGLFVTFVNVFDLVNVS